MPLAKGRFQNDDIGILLGSDGTESKDISAWHLRHKTQFPGRVAFAINQHYPEFRSGFYRNRQLMVLVQEVLLEVGLHVVIEDNHQENRLVPEELPGSLDLGDDYLLVDESLRIRGRLNVWESLGGKGAFYHDRLILEVVTDSVCAENLLQLTMSKCQARSVGCAVTRAG